MLSDRRCSFGCRRCLLDGRKSLVYGRRGLKPTDKGQPSCVIIFIINGFQTVSSGITTKFIATDGIFPERDDVGVAEEYPRAQTLSYHPFDDGC